MNKLIRAKPMTVVTASHTRDLITTYPHRTWEQFKLIEKGLEHLLGMRLSYYKGTVEILMPGTDHEFFKSIIGMLLEMFLFLKGIDFVPTGSVTQEREQVVSAQADESYCIGTTTRRSTPDLAIEVIYSSGKDKLARYQALGVPEVWFWEDGLFRLYHLRENTYENIPSSELPGLVDLDIALLTRCVLMAETSTLEAGRAFQRGLIEQ
jgi:Uma2 family endonuclease